MLKCGTIANIARRKLIFSHHDCSGMAIVTIRHSVEDFSKWKTGYDEGKSMIKSKGGKRQILYKNVDNPNELIVVTEVDSLDNARNIVQSDELKTAMHNAGVVGAPIITFLDEVEDATL